MSVNFDSIILISPKLGIGGIQRATANLSNWLISKGFSVFLISCKKEEIFYEVNEKVKVITPDFNYSLDKGKLQYYLKVIWYLRSELKKIDSKYVFSFGEAFNPLVLIASRGLGKSVFISDRTSPDYKHSLIISKLRRLTYPFAKALILQSQKSLNYNLNFFGKLPKFVIPNFIHPFDEYHNERNKSILYVGRFAWEKAPDRLIRAFSNIEDKMGFVLEMCGDGPMLEEMKSLTFELGIADKVIFHGPVYNIVDYYKHAGIFVLPSVLEGFPNAFCEALSTGLPSICYDSIPHEDIGKSNVDFLVVGKEFSTLEEALKHLIYNENERLKFSRNAVGIKERLSDENVGTKYLNLISDI
jgi:GalNAc-alpha-(1->4)-GalNAc-alpha-(1->3)-diNAcBac-PP-undecaprenol alpha-1,4-N-acetyl-D-galactosaminyltransferase